MKTESTEKPDRLKIEDLKNGKKAIYFFENIIEHEDKENTTIYAYDMYKIVVNDRERLDEDIGNNFEIWINFAKKCEYDELALKIRNKRNELLKETDKEMCIDRMGIKIPEEINAINLLTVVSNVFKEIGNILNNEMARYRQELRDITTQPGFPYNVIFPEKPNM